MMPLPSGKPKDTTALENERAYALCELKYKFCACKGTGKVSCAKITHRLNEIRKSKAKQ